MYLSWQKMLVRTVCFLLACQFGLAAFGCWANTRHRSEFALGSGVAHLLAGHEANKKRKHATLGHAQSQSPGSDVMLSFGRPVREINSEGKGR